MVTCIGKGATLNDLFGIIFSTSSPFQYFFFFSDLLDPESEIVKESAYEARNEIRSAYLCAHFYCIAFHK